LGVRLRGEWQDQEHCKTHHQRFPHHFLLVLTDPAVPDLGL
jgi:hypothetical protein